MMRLYSGTTCPFSHRCRIVLHEKGMDFEIIDVDVYDKPDDIATMNPYNEVPVLAERHLFLHEANIINEYIDERFPHPQLMHVDPAMRGKVRLFMYRFEKEIFSHVRVLEQYLQDTKGKETTKVPKEVQTARKSIAEALVVLSPIFNKNLFFLGDELGMLDISLAPLLWRLQYYGIDLPKTAAPILKYGERFFLRESFLASLTPAEKAMRK